MLLPDDFGVGHALLHAVHEGMHGGTILLGFCGNVTELKEGSLRRGFRLFRVNPFPAFGDVVPVCRGAFYALFDVSGRKAVLYGAELNRRMGKQIDMRMIGPALTDLVCEAKILWMKQVQPSIFPDGRNAGSFCGDLDMALRLINGHVRAGKLNLDKAFRLFHKLLLTVNAGTDFLKAVCRQHNDIAIAGHGIRALAIFILIRRCNIHQQLLYPQRGKITNIKHGEYLFLS